MFNNPLRIQSRTIPLNCYVRLACGQWEARKVAWSVDGLFVPSFMAFNLWFLQWKPDCHDFSGVWLLDSWFFFFYFIIHPCPVQTPANVPIFVICLLFMSFIPVTVCVCVYLSLYCKLIAFIFNISFFLA